MPPLRAPSTYLGVDRSGVVRASAHAPMTGLVLSASGGGLLEEAASGRYLRAGNPVRLAATGSEFQLTDAGGGKVVLTSGGLNVSVSGGKSPPRPPRSRPAATTT